MALRGVCVCFVYVCCVLLIHSSLISSQWRAILQINMNCIISGETGWSGRVNWMVWYSFRIVPKTQILKYWTKHVYTVLTYVLYMVWLVLLYIMLTVVKLSNLLLSLAVKAISLNVCHWNLCYNVLLLCTDKLSIQHNKIWWWLGLVKRLIRLCVKESNVFLAAPVK